MGIIGSRYTSANKDKVERVVNADDVQILRGDTLAAHSPSHLLTRPDTTRVLEVVKLDRRS